MQTWGQFGVLVDRSTISRQLKEQSLINKVNTRIASREDAVQQGMYQEKLAELLRDRVASHLTTVEVGCQSSSEMNMVVLNDVKPLVL